MFCKNCGAEVKEGAKFCPKCGEAMEKKTEMRTLVHNSGIQQILGRFTRQQLICIGAGAVVVVIILALGVKGMSAKKPDSDSNTQVHTDVEFVEPAAEDFEYSYNKELKGIIITGYTGIDEAIRIPAEIDGNPVKQVSLEKNRNIRGVELPDSVTSIGRKAFSGCNSLTEIRIPDSVTSIGEWAFCGCGSLTKISLPDSVTSIGKRAFQHCSLTEIRIPDSVTSIGEGAFSDCISLTEISISDSVTSIGGWTFEGCDSLTKIRIPDSVTSIGPLAFQGCNSLTEVSIPDGVTSIASEAFGCCESLTEIRIPDSVTSISDNVFAGNHLTVTYKGNKYSNYEWGSICREINGE